MKIMICFFGLQACLPAIVSAQQFDLWIANRKLTSSRVLEFDLMIKTTDSGVVIPLKFVQAGYRFNPLFTNGGNLAGSYVPGSSQLEAAFGKTWGFSYNASRFVLNQSANVGSYCPGAFIGNESRRVARFRVTNTVNWGCADDSISFVTSGSGTLKLAVVKYNSLDCSDANPSVITSLCNPFTLYPNSSALDAASVIFPLQNPCDSSFRIFVGASGGAEPYFGSGIFYAGAGSHQFVVSDARGCLDTAVTDIQHFVFETSFCDSGCEKYILPWGNAVIESGNYSHTYESESGCDSMVTAHITIFKTDTTAVSIQLWPHQLPYLWNGINCMASGIYNTLLSNSSGCDSLVTLSLTVLDTCSPKGIISTAVNDSICPEGSAALTVSGNLQAGAQWHWYAGSCGSGSLIGRGQSIRVAPQNTSSYFVRSQGGSCGITECVSQTVYVKNRPALPGQISGTSTGLCLADNITYTLEPVLSASTYQWYVPEGAVLQTGQGSPAVRVSFSDKLTSSIQTSYNNICVRSVNSCGVSACRNLSISLKPSASGTMEGPDVLFTGQEAIYSSSVFGANGFNWSVPSGWRIISGQGTRRIQVRAGSSNGYIRLIPSNSCGHGGSGVKYVTVSSIQAREISDPSLFIYPNPVAAVLYLHINGGSPDYLEVCDMQGRICKRIPWAEKINLQALPPGIYWIRVFLKEAVLVRKFQIIR